MATAVVVSLSLEYLMTCIMHHYRGAYKWYDIFFFFGILLYLFAWSPFMNTYDNGSDAPTYFGIISTISMLQNCNTNFIYMPLLH